VRKLFGLDAYRQLTMIEKWVLGTVRKQQAFEYREDDATAHEGQAGSDQVGEGGRRIASLKNWLGLQSRRRF
jgi:hypothetical protein